MPRFTILPLVGIGPVSLSASRASCQAAFGAPSWSEKNADFYFRNSLKVAFTEDGHIEFFEIARDEYLETVYREVDLFASPASEVVALFASEEPYEEYSGRDDSGYIFDQLEIALWRWELVDGPDPFLESIVIGSKGYFSGQRWLADPSSWQYSSTDAMT